MKTDRRIAIPILAALALPLSAAAQTPTRPRLELGAGFGVATMPPDSFEAYPSGRGVSPRLNLRADGNLDQNWSVEVGLDRPDASAYDVFYIQGARVVPRASSGRTTVLATFGLGWRLVSAQPPFNTRYTYLDDGRGGVAVQYLLGRYAAIRGDVQFMFYGVGDAGAAFGVRPMLGISIPIGHY